MKKLKHDLTGKMLRIQDAILLTVPLAVIWLFYGEKRTVQISYGKETVTIIALFLLAFMLGWKVYDRFMTVRNRISMIAR